MTKTERFPMVQCTSCSKEIQLSVFEKHCCLPSQRLSKITGHFPVVLEKSSLFTSLQEIFPDKPLENLEKEKVATKALDIQQAVEEVLATETEYDGVHVQPSPDRSREVIASY